MSNQLGQAIEAGEFPEGYFLNGDSAFVLSNSMIVPTGLAEFQNFDFEQSSNHMAIEYVPSLELNNSSSCLNIF
jgi:hypothetical protein